MTYANQATADATFEGRQRRPQSASTGRALRSWIVSMIERWKTHRQQKQSIQHLRQLGDDTLRDIGIDRSEIVSTVMHGRTGR